MRFFKRRRKDIDPEDYLKIKYRAVDANNLMRNFLLDSRLAEAQQLSTIIGLPSLDDEDMEEEIAEAEYRCLKVAPVTPLLHFLTDTLAHAVIEYFYTVSDVEVTDEEREAIGSLFGRVCLASSIAAVSQLEDLGIINYEYEVVE